jgi:recombination protein RecR
MLTLPTALTELIHRLARLPGVGPKAAERMALKLLGWPAAELGALAEALREATARVAPCPQCGCLAQDGALCAVCDDPQRDPRLLCVVESPLDAVALERGGGFRGRYHVLGGALSPLRGVLPEDLRIAELLARVRRDAVGEVIVATNASPDGEATALYLKQVLGEAWDLDASTILERHPEALADAATDAGGDPALPQLRVTRLARGLPSGGQLDYADAATLASALEHRTEL